jgi:hypothetical protein
MLDSMSSMEISKWISYFKVKEFKMEEQRRSRDTTSSVKRRLR